MKLKYILGAVALMCFATTLQAQDNTKDIKDLRIYINPGHGGFDGGDRHMGTVKHGPVSYLDTTAFFETNTNLWKSLATFQLLVDYGFKFDPTLNPFPENFVGYNCNHDLHNLQTNADEKYRYGAARDMSQGIVMSHVKTGLSRNINEIAAEVEFNNFDLFISIHSNAATEGTSVNYPGFFIRGEKRTALVPGSEEFARICWPHAFANTHSQWSTYSMTNVGLYYDIDFWGGQHVIVDYGNGNIVKGYYAVLRHNVPGMLAEGYFHTYQPARHRAMNPDVCAIEGIAYARGIADYFGIQKEKTGELYGIVRDLHEKFSHTFYNAPNTSPDAYLPINNAVVKLKDESGKVVATYTTDDEYNGAFVFRHLDPGKYTIEVDAEGYKPAEAEYCGPFEVKAAETTYPCVYIENVDYVPYVGDPELKLSDVLVDPFNPYVIEVTKQVDKDFVPVDNTTIDWSSDNASVATVDAAGVVTGIAEGETVVHGKIGEVEMLLNVKVEVPTARYKEVYPAGTTFGNAKSGVKDVTVTPSQSGVATIDFTISNNRSPYVEIQSQTTSYAIPDSLKLVVNPGTANIKSVYIAYLNQAGRKATQNYSVEFPNEKTSELVVPFTDFIDKANRGEYPLTLTGIRFYLNNTNGSTHKIEIPEYSFVYDGVKASNGIDEVKVDTEVISLLKLSSNPVVAGETVVVGVDGPIYVFNMSGKLVLKTVGNSFVAPTQSGVYVVKTGNSAAKLVVK